MIDHDEDDELDDRLDDVDDVMQSSVSATLSILANGPRSPPRLGRLRDFLHKSQLRT